MNTTEGWIPGTLTDVTERFFGVDFADAFVAIATEINDLKSEIAYIRDPDYHDPVDSHGGQCTWHSLTGFDDHIPFGMAKWEPSPGCLLIHNHPSKLPPSRSDVEFLFWKPGSRIVVLGDLPYHLARSGKVITTADLAIAMRRVHLSAIARLHEYAFERETAYAFAWWHTFKESASELGVIMFD